MKVNRKIIISELREQRKTYQEIAEILKISKQRVCQIYKDYKPTDNYVRNKILERDSKKCLICDSQKNLEVHHINGIKIDNNQINLATLCRKCHKRIEKKDRELNGKKQDIIPRIKSVKKIPNINSSGENAKGHLLNCFKCLYVWQARIESPKSCPRCKQRMDTIKKKIMESQKLKVAKIKTNY